MTFVSSGKPASSSTAAAIDASHLRDVLRRASDPVVARLLQDFIHEQELQQSYPGAYLVALESIKRSQIRYARAKEQGRFVRSLVLRLCSILRRSASLCRAGMCWAARACTQRAARPHAPVHASNVLELPGPGAGTQRRSAAQSGR
ncbi:MAG: hypothetical protein ACLGJD_18170 [Gammaproteobacteria bacterium]|uniref:hypothetical protein n=1 Tax=uncultured Pseudacidovorax sp. TaxID=679313 RepID=UPI0025E6FE52|nr:hypothetical protein [uncultured Pseudacidovorax sp.]